MHVLTDAIIEKTSIALAKNVLKISPPVPRRKGWEDTDEETGIFYIKFKRSEGRDEVRVMLLSWGHLQAGRIVPVLTLAAKHGQKS